MMRPELRIAAGGAMRLPLVDIGNLYEASVGTRVVYQFGTTPELISLLLEQPTFDLGVVPNDVLLNDRAAAAFVADSIVDVARVGLGIAVARGEGKPDISSPQALRDTLLRARSLASIPASAAGAQAERVYTALGISAEMHAKIRAKKAPGEIVAALAAGEVELGVFFANVLMAPEVELLDDFPPSLQQKVAFRAGVTRTTKQAPASQAFVDFLSTAEVATILTERGMEPCKVQSQP